MLNCMLHVIDMESPFIVYMKSMYKSGNHSEVVN